MHGEDQGQGHGHGHGHGHGPHAAATDGHHHHHDFDSADMAARLEAEGEALAPLAEIALDRLSALAAERSLSIRRILDVGAGPGVSAAALADRFPEASVLGVDGAVAMVERGRARAVRLGVDDRVEMRRVELPGGLVGLGTFDVVWASMVLHHVGDEVAALGHMKSLIGPGGLIALIEFVDKARYVPPLSSEFDRPGLWDRVGQAWGAWFDEMRASVADSVESQDLATMVTAADLDPLCDEDVQVELDVASAGEGLTHALHQVEHTLERTGERLDEADRAVLRALVDPTAPEYLGGSGKAFRVTRRLVVASA